MGQTSEVHTGQTRSGGEFSEFGERFSFLEEDLFTTDLAFENQLNNNTSYKG